MSFTVYVCRECGAQAEHGQWFCPAGHRSEPQAVEVVPRAVADGLAAAVEAAPNTIAAREAVREYREKV